MSYTDPFLLSSSKARTVFRLADTGRVRRATFTPDGLHYQILAQDGKDYEIPEMAHPLSYPSAMLGSINLVHWTEEFWPKDVPPPNYDELDAARTVLYEKKLPRAAILGVKGQEHLAVNRYGQPFTLLRILLTVTPEFADETELRVPLQIPDKNVYNDLGRWPLEEKKFPKDRVDGYGVFHSSRTIPTGKATELCIFQELCLHPDGDPVQTRDMDNHIFGGWQSLLAELEDYVGCPRTCSGRWYY